MVGAQSFLVSVVAFWRVEGEWSGNAGWGPIMDSLNPRMRILSLLGIPRLSPGLVICWEDSQDSTYSHTHNYDLLQLKDTRHSQQIEKTCGAKSGEN